MQSQEEGAGSDLPGASQTAAGRERRFNVWALGTPEVRDWEGKEDPAERQCHVLREEEERANLQNTLSESTLDVV